MTSTTTTTTTVYRVEHEHYRCGPYDISSEIPWDHPIHSLTDAMSWAHSNDVSRHPNDWLDGMRATFTREEKPFACPTLGTLADWFDGYWDELIECGFRIYEYDATNITVGISRRQLTFTPVGERRDVAQRLAFALKDSDE